MAPVAYVGFAAPLYGWNIVPWSCSVCVPCLKAPVPLTVTFSFVAIATEPVLEISPVLSIWSTWVAAGSAVGQVIVYVPASAAGAIWPTYAPSAVLNSDKRSSPARSAEHTSELQSLRHLVC